MTDSMDHCRCIKCGAEFTPWNGGDSECQDCFNFDLRLPPENCHKWEVVTGPISAMLVDPKGGEEWYPFSTGNLSTGQTVIFWRRPVRPVRGKP